MAKSRVFKSGRADAEFNMTPMIDVTFQLIIFFMLAGTFASMDNIPLEVPQLQESVAEDQKLTDKAVINVPLAAPEAKPGEPDYGLARAYAIGGIEIPIGDPEALRQRISDAKSAFDAQKQSKAELADKEFQIEIRADRAVHYGQIAPVMQAASKLKIAKMNLTALERAGIRR